MTTTQPHLQAEERRTKRRKRRRKHKTKHKRKKRELRKEKNTPDVEDDKYIFFIIYK